MKPVTIVGIAVLTLLAITVLLFAGYPAIVHRSEPVPPEDPLVELPFHGEYGRDLYLHNNRSAADPTFDHLCDFLRRNNADRMNRSWRTGEVYQVRLHDDAEAEGIRAGMAVFKPNSESTYRYMECDAYNLFKTVDRGVVYVYSGDSILFYHKVFPQGASYMAYCVPLDNLSRADIRWSEYPDVSPEQIEAAGPDRFCMDIYGIDYYW